MIRPRPWTSTGAHSAAVFCISKHVIYFATFYFQEADHQQQNDIRQAHLSPEREEGSLRPQQGDSPSVQHPHGGQGPREARHGERGVFVQQQDVLRQGGGLLPAEESRVDREVSVHS